MKQKYLIKSLAVSTLALSLLVPTAGAVQVHAATTTASVSTSNLDAFYNKVDYNFEQEVLEHINDKNHFAERKAISDTLGLYDNYKDTKEQKFGISKAIRAIYAKNQVKIKYQTIDAINSNYKGSSIVDYLKSAKQPSSFKDRKALAEKLLINDYSGTAKQNAEMLKLLRSNGK